MMRFRTELNEADLAKGFHTETDLFGRRDLALRLTGLYQQLDHGSVSLLDGRWGAGKTTFVKQWKAELAKLDIPAIYFDAFASDYIDSPFQAVAGAFVKAAIEARRADQPAYRTYLSKAAAVGKTIASVSAKVGVKAATLGVVSPLELGEIGNAIADGLSDISEEAVKDLLEEHATLEAKFNELRNSLGDLPRLLAPRVDTGTNPHLIIFIDELDRCKPDYSLGILEVLKHFFRANHLHFVLVTNRRSLELSVKHRYGVGEAASEYLEKFYDFSIFFENEYDRYEQGNVSVFVSRVLQPLIPLNTRSGADTAELVRSFSIAFRLSLRQIESYATNVAISFLAIRENELRPAVLVSWLSLIKMLRPEMYQRAKGGTLVWSEVSTFLKSGHWKDTENERIENIVRYYVDPEIDLNDPQWRDRGDAIWNYNIERHQVVKYLANHVLDRFAAPYEKSPVSE